MLALAIELLTGRYVATAYNDRNAPEWPPHPARVFSALVATHHAGDPPDLQERAALLWLERQPPPSIAVSAANPRPATKVFVPINDTTAVGFRLKDELALASAETEAREADAALLAAQAGGASDPQLAQLHKAEEKAAKALEKTALKVRKQVAKDAAAAGASKAGVQAAVSLLPDRRTRKERTFPSVTPEHPTVHLIWTDAAAPDGVRQALAQLVSRVTRIGHSSSLVSLRLVDEPPAPAWVPDEGGTAVLRAVSPGQLQRLEEEFERHRETLPRVLPARFQAYAEVGGEPEPERPHTAFGDDWIVLERVGGRLLPATATIELAGTLRRALLSYADEPVLEALSGHRADGSPSERPHVAFVPLPFACEPHADGCVRGVAVVLPRGLHRDERRHVLRAIGRWEKAAGDDAPLRLVMGRRGVVEVARRQGPPALHTLDPATWCRPARAWVTVTPIALDRHPGSLGSRNTSVAERALTEARQSVIAACRRIDLAAEPEVEVLAHPLVRGSRGAKAFGPFPRREPGDGRPRKMLVHACLTFAGEVRGPLLLGAGRYLGLGLLRPLA